MQTSKVSFCGVTQYRVFINGMPSTDPQNIQRAQRALVKILVGPTNKNPQHQKISAIFAQGDRDYSYERAYNGYLQVKGETASNYFRTINDRIGQFIVTGQYAKKLKEFGKKLGQVRQMQNQHGVPNSFELHAAKENYGKYVHTCLNSFTARTKFNNKPAILNIFTKSSGTYGKKDFKLAVQDVSWSI